MTVKGECPFSHNEPTTLMYLQPTHITALISSLQLPRGGLPLLVEVIRPATSAVEWVGCSTAVVCNITTYTHCYTNCYRLARTATVLGTHYYCTWNALLQYLAGIPATPTSIRLSTRSGYLKGSRLHVGAVWYSSKLHVGTIRHISRLHDGTVGGATLGAIPLSICDT